MRKEYTKPEISTEILLTEDVLKVSEERDNSYVQSNLILGGTFDIESIL